MKALRITLLLFTLLALSHPLISQACKRCSELPTPAPGSAPEDLMRVYLEGENGIGGNDCWVQCHPYGQGFVITPNSWGAEPNPVRGGLINAAFEAITDSRRVMENLGTLQRSIYILLNDINPGYAGAYWPVGEECWIPWWRGYLPKDHE